MDQSHVLGDRQRYRVLVAWRTDRLGASRRSWQANYLSDTIPDRDAILASSAVWFVEIWDRHTDLYVG